MKVDRAGVKLRNAALQHLNEFNARDGYTDARRRVLDRQNSEEDVRAIVREFCGREIKL